MAYYKPCKNCAADKASCARRAEITKAIAGLSVTVVNFRCTDRQALFSANQRVSFNWISWERDDCGEDHSLGLIFHGTVMHEHGLRFIVRVDEGPSADAELISSRDVFKSENLVVKVKPADMLALDEPAKKLCPSCSAYEGEDGRCLGWNEDGFGYWPDGCLKHAIPSPSWMRRRARQQGNERENDVAYSRNHEVPRRRRTYHA